MARWPSVRFDSDTTRNDFSNTFQSLMVLSKCSGFDGIGRPKWRGVGGD